MLAERKNSLISGPKIRMTDSALPVNARQRVPEGLCISPVPFSHITFDNLSRVNIFCQSYPLLIPFITDVGFQASQQSPS